MNNLSRIFKTEWRFALRTRVKDTVTGFEGTITARIEYLNGCRQYCVEAKLDKEGKFQKQRYMDEEQLELILKLKKKATKKSERSSGGRMPNEPE